MKFISFTIFFTLMLSSCNVKHERPAKKETPKLENKIEKKGVSKDQAQRLSLNSSYRKSLLELLAVEHKTDSLDIDNSLNEYINSFEDDLKSIQNLNSSIDLYKVDILISVKTLQDQISSIESLNMTKEYWSTKKGHKKNLYVRLLEKLNTKDYIVKRVLNPKTLKQDLQNQIFAKHLAEITIKNAILEDKKLLDFELITQDKASEVIEKLDKALLIKNLLVKSGYDYKIKGEIRRKLKRIDIDNELLERDERLLEIQLLVDRLLN